MSDFKIDEVVKFFASNNLPEIDCKQSTQIDKYNALARETSSHYFMKILHSNTLNKRSKHDYTNAQFGQMTLTAPKGEKPNDGHLLLTIPPYGGNVAGQEHNPFCMSILSIVTQRSFYDETVEGQRQRTCFAPDAKNVQGVSPYSESNRCDVCPKKKKECLYQILLKCVYYGSKNDGLGKPGLDSEGNPIFDAKFVLYTLQKTGLSHFWDHISPKINGLSASFQKIIMWTTIFKEGKAGTWYEPNFLAMIDTPEHYLPVLDKFREEHIPIKANNEESDNKDEAPF